MVTLQPFLLTMIAGILNGSYAGISRSFKNWPQEVVWLFFSLFAFVLVPVVTILLIQPHSIELILQIPLKVELQLIAGGATFGIGMIAFTWALRLLGLGVSFVLNVSMGTIFGSLVPLFFTNPEKIFSTTGYFDLAALSFFVISVILSSAACSSRYNQADQQNENVLEAKNYRQVIAGILIGIISGIFCSAQGIAYASFLTYLPAQRTSTPLYPWIIIFFSAFLPYSLYHLFVIRAKGYQKKMIKKYFSLRYGLLLMTMGMLYFIPLILYSQAVATLGKLGTVFAWPLFMCFIVLTSNLWGISRGEWKNSGTQSITMITISLVSILLAIVLLSVGARP